MKKYLIGLLVVVLSCHSLGIAHVFKTDAVAFVLTNEGEDRMIDRLCSAGCFSLYDALLYLRNNMAAEAPQVLTDRIDKLIDSLEALKGEGEIFNALLDNFAGPGNSPVGICSDGTFIRSDFSILSYDWLSGFTRYEGRVKFTYPISIADYIYLGSRDVDLGGGATKEIQYMAFAVAWDDSIPTNTNELARAKFAVYPNPAIEFIEISGLNSLAIEKIQLFNLLGERVSGLSCELIDADRARIRVSGLPAGFYVVQTANGSKGFAKIGAAR